MTGPSAALLALLGTLVFGPAQSESPGQTPRIECRRLGEDDALRIDGRLDEPAWSTVAWSTDFRQSVPDYNAPATEATSVAFLCDRHAVYVAVRCGDSAPEKIRASRLRHRDEPSTDDHVEVIFDTYRDQVRGTVFVVNALGAKEEGLVNGYQRYTWSWDDVWEARTSLTEAGWQVELRIPLRLLRYASGNAQEWGVNVMRTVRRKQEEVYLVPPRPPFDISSLDYAAALAGLDLSVRQRNLQVIPYALTGVVRESDSDAVDDTSRTVSEAGVDVKVSLTSDLTLDGTYNTDFSQVESDNEQVNLTRFSLFYPEKREFFLDNANLFSFAASSATSPHGSEVTPFFSRRIGIYRGMTVPIDGGVRLTGKAGRQDIGLLSITTAPVPELGLASAWYNVARVRRDLGNRTYIGAIVTDSRRGDVHSTTVGVDASWFITRPLSLRGSVLSLADSDADGTRDAWDIALDLTTDPWGFLFACSRVDLGFEPDLGFVTREGFRKAQALLRRSIRPGRWGVRRVTFRTINSWYDSLEHGVRESAENWVQCEIELDSGDELNLEAGRTFERLFEPFDLDDGLSFAAGDYTFDTLDLSYHTDESRRWGFDGTLKSGGFYGGDRTEVEGEGWLVFSPHLRAAGTYATYDISAAQGGLAWRLWGARLDYIHSANLSASTLVQYNSSSGTTTLNFRLRWILRNDSDLYLVFNDRREEIANRPIVRGREIALKINYRLFL